MKSDDELVFLPSVRLAAESDSYVVEKFVVEAKAAVGNEMLLFQDAALEPLVATLISAASGQIARSDWRTAIANALKDVNASSQPVQPRFGELMQTLRARVPSDAHASRLQRALDELLREMDIRASSPGSKASALSSLLHGSRMLPAQAAACSIVSPLQMRILAELTSLASPPLGLTGLVQSPLLSVLGHGVDLPSPLTMSDGTLAASSSDHNGSPSAPAGEPLSIVDATPARLFLLAAELARCGDQKGSKHGCLLVIPDDAADSATSTARANAETEPAKCEGAHSAGGRAAKARILDAASCNGKARILGRGWNHDVYERRENTQRRRVLHAECHAIADAIRTLGEEAAFAAFPRASCWIVELEGEAAYSDAPPCPKCALLLRACGVTKAIHSTREGTLAELEIPPHRPDLLAVEMACKPLCYACDEMSVRCERLEAALQEAAAKTQQRRGGAASSEARGAKKQRTQPSASEH